MGLVGWPISILSIGGALLGRHLDIWWHTGIRMTLMLLTAGVLIGSSIAWRAMQKK
jgi:hypothetical protein